MSMFQQFATNIPPTSIASVIIKKNTYVLACPSQTDVLVKFQ